MGAAGAALGYVFLMPTQDEIDEAELASKKLYELHTATFSSLEGAASLIARYGDCPSFHDGEITEVTLRRTGVSKLRVRIPYPDIFGRGSVFVTFEIAQLLDVELEGFSPQNVIFGLYLTPSPSNPEPQAHYGIDRDKGDLRIELEPTWGVGGHLICRGVKISWTMDHIARKLQPAPPPGPELLGQ